MYVRRTENSYFYQRKIPTIAKDSREILTETIPDEVDEVLDNMQNIRQQLKGDFEYKVQELNRLTTEYLSKEDSKDKQNLEIEKTHPYYKKLYSEELIFTWE